MQNKVYNSAGFETDRLILRQWNMNDIADMVEGLNNINVTKWLEGAPYPYI